MKRILVVEDEAAIREMVALNLKRAGWDVLEAPSAERALELLHGEPCDAALLDIMLPGMDGLSLCETIRRDNADIGIIIVSAKGQEQDKIRGLSIGADDYITKPFSVSELIARGGGAGAPGAPLRLRRGRSAEPDQLISGPFVLDGESRVLYKSGRPIDLTQVEFQIMELFFKNPGTALVRDKILEGVWGQGLLRRRQDRGRQHPPPAHEGGGRAQQPPAYPDGVGLRLPLERIKYRRGTRKGGAAHGKGDGWHDQQHHTALAARRPADHHGPSGAGRDAVPVFHLRQPLRQRAAGHVQPFFHHRGPAARHRHRRRHRRDRVQPRPRPAPHRRDV